MQAYDVEHYILKQTEGLSDLRIRQLCRSLFVRLYRDREQDCLFRYSAMTALCMQALKHDAAIRVGMLTGMLGPGIPNAWCELDGAVYDFGVYAGVPDIPSLAPWVPGRDLPVINEKYEDIWYANYEPGVLPQRWRMFEALSGMTLRDYFDRMPGTWGQKSWKQMLEALRLDCGLGIQEAGLKSLAATVAFPKAGDVKIDKERL